MSDSREQRNLDPPHLQQPMQQRVENPNQNMHQALATRCMRVWEHYITVGYAQPMHQQENQRLAQINSQNSQGRNDVNNYQSAAPQNLTLQNRGQQQQQMFQYSQFPQQERTFIGVPVAFQPESHLAGGNLQLQPQVLPHAAYLQNYEQLGDRLQSNYLNQRQDHPYNWNGQARQAYSNGSPQQHREQAVGLNQEQIQSPAHQNQQAGEAALMGNAQYRQGNAHPSQSHVNQEQVQPPAHQQAGGAELMGNVHNRQDNVLYRQGNAHHRPSEVLVPRYTYVPVLASGTMLVPMQMGIFMQVPVLVLLHVPVQNNHYPQ